MTQVPEAVFVVERRPGQGYGITSATGPRAEALQRAAVEVLDELGQPDPRGPEEVQRWLPAAGPDRQPVHVRIRRTSDGESIYHQAWFPPAQPRRPWRWPLLWLPACLVLFLAGATLGWSWRGPGEGPREPTPQPAEIPRPGPGVGPHRTEALLQVPMQRSREARKKLADFFAEPGLTGWPDEAGVLGATVEVRDFRKTPRGVKIDAIYLTGDEVRSLRTLLEALDGVP